MAGAVLTILPAVLNAKAATMFSPWVDLENHLSYEYQAAARCTWCLFAIIAMSAPYNVFVASAYLILFLSRSHFVYLFDNSV